MRALPVNREKTEDKLSLLIEDEKLLEEQSDPYN